MHAPSRIPTLLLVPCHTTAAGGSQISIPGGIKKKKGKPTRDSQSPPCWFCERELENPVSFPCGHKFCSHCWGSLLGMAPWCPYCGQRRPRPQARMVRAVPYTPAPDDPPLPEARIVSVRRGDETLFEGVPFLGVVASVGACRGAVPLEFHDGSQIPSTQSGRAVGGLCLEQGASDQQRREISGHRNGVSSLMSRVPHRSRGGQAGLQVRTSCSVAVGVMHRGYPVVQLHMMESCGGGGFVSGSH